MKDKERALKTALEDARLIVIKVGSVLVAEHEQGTARSAWMETLADDITKLTAQGKQVVLVSSGAIALGRKSLNIDDDKSGQQMKLEQKQAAASVGQIKLSSAWDQAFKKYNRNTAQILISPHDTENRRTFLNARAALYALLENGIIPVINENDTTATDEIRFGDNDRLAARITQMIAADLLLIFSTTEGLFTADPTKDETATHIPVIEKLDEAYFKMAGNAISTLSTGGMKSKLEAAKIAVDAGAHVIIAKGTANNPLSSLKKSTLILAQDNPYTARKKWLQAYLKPKGSITIDDGAFKALQGGKSLLPAGVISVSGEFYRGDAIEIKDKNHHTVAIGLMAYDSRDTEKIIGHKSEDIAEILGYSRREVLVHRNDMVLKE